MPDRGAGSAVRAGVRGLIATMAMSGTREFTAGVGGEPGVRYPERRRLTHRAMLAADHVMYGVVVAGRLAPVPEVRPR